LDATKATSNIVLPLLLDNSSWQAFVYSLRAQLDSSPSEETRLDLIIRTRQIVRAHQEMKSVAAERKRIAERLSQLASIIDCSSDAIVVYTLNGSIASWNMAAENVYGYSAGEILGRSRSILPPLDQPDDLLEIVGRFKRGEKIQRFETVQVGKGGRRIDVSIAISPVKDASEQIVGVAAISRDISDRKFLEKQLRQAQKMEAIGQLAGGIAHDFNNLLSVINGYCELLEQELRHNATAGRNCQQIKKAGERAASLTRQLLAFSRQQVLEPAVLDLNTVVLDLEKMLRRVIGEDVEFEPNSRIDNCFGGTETILLVEDEDALRSLTRDLLISSGYRLLEAGSPEKALQTARQYAGPIHLLLTDVIMPGMNGRALAQELVTARPEKKVVYMSGYAGFRQPHLLDAESGPLSKPFKREILLRKLRDALASN